MTATRARLGKAATLLESTLPRAIDVALVVLLLRSLAPEDVGLLESSQAIVVPLMILFLSPEQILYKELSTWREGGSGAHVARVGALRQFCWLKGLAGAFLAVLLSVRGGRLNAGLFSAFLWAFSRTLAPQVIGIDRDYLRISGRVGQTLALVLAQKLLFLAGVVVAVSCCRARVLAALAGAGVLSVLASAGFGAVLSGRLDAGRGHRTSEARWSRRGFGVGAVFREVFTRFSIWSHVDYVAATTVETLDVFTLGILAFPKRAIGIYGAAVRVANFAFALPTAANLWFGMRIGQARPDHELRRSLAAMARPSAVLFVLSAAQTAALVVAAPLIGEVLGARWTAVEKGQFAAYLVALALGTGLYTATFAVMTWLKLVHDVRSLFARVFAPWLVFTGALYFHYGLAGDILAIAWSNVACYAFYMLLTANFIITAPKRGAHG